MLSVSDLDLGGARPLTHAFPSGAITVVLGRNNAGKTRLARLLCGLETSAPGTVSIGGEDVSGRDARARSVALVFQAFVNYPNRTVAQNIASPLVAQRLAPAVITERVAELAAKLRIDPWLDRLPHELSGGQQQRVAIARALAQDGQVLVMDEPLVNLDYKLREELELELREVLADPERVVVYNTSDPREAFRLGDEVLLLDARAKLQSGAPMGVYSNPNSLAAAHLMSDPGVNAWRERGRVYAVRPEHLGIGAAGPGRVTFETTLVGVETNGADTILHCRYQQADWVVRLAGMHRLETGRALTLHAGERDVLGFD